VFYRDTLQQHWDGQGNRVRVQITQAINVCVPGGGGL
jgi:hypothetical protein